LASGKQKLVIILLRFLPILPRISRRFASFFDPMEQLNNRQAFTPVILAIGVASVVWYLTLLLNPVNIGQPFAYGLLLIAEAIGMFQILGTWITIIIGKPEKTRYDVLAVKSALKKNPKLAGKVIVLVPVSGEPLDVITKTLTAARDVRFPHETYVCDDGRSDDTKALAHSLGIGYFRRNDRAGWKAGNLNNALRQTKSDFFVVFDSDHVAHPEFLNETLPWILSDQKLAFVQTPQHLVNREGFVSGGIAESQEMFYRHIQTGKNAFNSAFCVGTNVIFRTKAVMELGGMYDKSHSEDIWTAMLLHERGWKSVYLPTVLAHGQAPETVESYLRQQFRWASGGYEILFRRNPLLNKGLTLDQKLQYFHTAMFFTSGFSMLIFFLLPLFTVYFGWKPLQIPAGAGSWAAHFVPYFIMMYVGLAHLMGHFPKWRTIVMGVGAFPAHINASLAVLTGLKLRWKASGVALSNIDYIKSIVVHLLLLLLSVAAVPVVFLTEKNMTLSLITCFWLAWNSILLGSICMRAIPKAEKVPVPSTVPVSA
jgi:cellulose synthase (UDP-forming)